MAPEILKDEEYNQKVDIWAFGCIIYELFTLNVCFEGKSLYGVVDKIINQEHGKINTNFYNIKWQNLIDLLLNKDYKKRPDIDKIYKLIIEENKNKTKRIEAKEYFMNNLNRKQLSMNSKLYYLFNLIINIIVFVVGDPCVGKTSLIGV